MADLVITEANIDLVSGQTGTLDAAETITAGDVLYAVSSTTCGVADCTDAAKDKVVGIALNAGSTGHPVVYARSGAIVDFWAIITVGTWYALSTTGLIMPVADFATSDYASYIGYGITTARIQTRFINTGLQIA